MGTIVFDEFSRLLSTGEFFLQVQLVLTNNSAYFDFLAAHKVDYVAVG